MKSEDTRPSIALILYGIGRGGALVKGGIEKNIINGLQELGKLSIIEVRDNVTHISNPRSSEFGRLEVDQFYFNNSIKELIDTDNETVLDAYNKSMLYVDVHNDGFVSNINLVKQLYLLDRSVLLLKSLDHKPEYVFAMRDDVFLTSAVDLEKIIKKIRDHKNYFTSTHYWQGGVCERIFISSFSDAIYILSRFNILNEYYEKIWNLSYVKRKGLNAEWFIRYCLEREDFKVSSLPIKLQRVRLGGRIQHDNLLPRPWRLSCFFRSVWSYFRFIFNLK